METVRALLTIAGVVVALLAFLGLTTWLGGRFSLHAELKRKILHTGLGLSTLTFPLLFHHVWEMGLLTAIMLAVMTALRRLPILKAKMAASLHDVDRTSFGEIYFVLSVLVLFVLGHDRPVLYVVPLIILTLSDAAAALVGVRFGKHSFDVAGGKKSLEGTLAFVVVTFVSVVACLCVLADLPWEAILLIAFLLSVFGALIEAVSSQGLDNIFVPLGCYLLLSHYLHAGRVELISTVAVLVAVGACVLWQAGRAVRAGARP
jgi:phytol kinase